MQAMDPASPTTAEQGQVNVPCPPSSNSSQSARPGEGANGGFGSGCFGNFGKVNTGQRVNVGGCNPYGNTAGFQEGFRNMDYSNPQLCYVAPGPYPSQNPMQPGPYGSCPSPINCGLNQSRTYGPCGNMPGTYGQNPGVSMSSCQYPRVPGLMTGNVSSGCNLPGGVTPQASNVRQIVDLLQTLDGNQTRVLQQILAERLDSQVRGNPEFFGELPRSSGKPFLPDLGQHVWNEEGVSRPEKDVFSRTEKWLAPAPTPAVDLWKSREQEILGWNEYLAHLVAWAAQASEVFATEIQQAAKWHTTIPFNSLTVQQRSRASRLFAILKAAFSGHARTSMLISVFAEGLDLHERTGMVVSVGQANSNGLELVRQLGVEFSLRSRGEALTLRTHLASKTFALQSSETTPGTVVTDTIRKLDYECSRFSKLLSTLPTNVDPTGLSFPEADMLLMLLRSLPQQVRDFCLHHAEGESFLSYRNAARRWEGQQRIFNEIGNAVGSSGKRSMLISF